MIYLALFIALLAVPAVLWAKQSYFKPVLGSFFKYFTIGSPALGILVFVFMSSVWVDKAEVGHLNRIYFGEPMPKGRIIAKEGQKGPQANILPPGFHFSPFIRALNEVSFESVVSIRPGNYGILHAKDGLPLDGRQIVSYEWSSEIEKMLDGEYFLGEGKGQKGVQLTVLPPGNWRINRFLFDVSIKPAVDVPVGTVAVIKSNAKSRRDITCPNVVQNATASANNDLANTLVPEGCVGVWDEPLPPGRYNLNSMAHNPVIVPTKAMVWSYKGGYTSRIPKLTVNDDGTIKQEIKEEYIKVPDTAADSAINVRVEGWTIPVELRVLAAIEPKKAPMVVSSVGGMDRLENVIITPSVRDIVRTVGGRKSEDSQEGESEFKLKASEVAKRRVLDFVDSRKKLAREIEKELVIEAAKAGATVLEVRLGEPSVPPELMIARLREQLAGQLSATYKEEEQAQKLRVSVERERALAEQQGELVKAEIKMQAAEHRKAELRLLGEGKKLELQEIARGQEAQARVLGKDRTLQLEMLKEILPIVKENPDVIKVPLINVTGSGGSGDLGGAAAILGGASNISALIQESKSKTEK